jgi:hypothetical protein
MVRERLGCKCCVCLSSQMLKQIQDVIVVKVVPRDVVS